MHLRGTWSTLFVPREMSLGSIPGHSSSGNVAPSVFIVINWARVIRPPGHIETQRGRRICDALFFVTTGLLRR